MARPRCAFLVLLVWSVPFHSEMSRAESPPCDSLRISVPLEQRIGSSSIFANLFGSEDSVKAQLKSMLDQAESAVSQAMPPVALCPAHCSVGPTPQLLFSATPRQFLDEYEDRERCDRHFEQTSRVPIAFRDRTFNNFRDLSKSFSSIARGSGEMGEELYRLCDGACSPRYRISVTLSPHGPYRSDIEVVCGPARDRDNSEYDLGTALLWRCEDRRSAD